MRSEFSGFAEAVLSMGKAGDWTLKEILGEGYFNVVIAAERYAVDRTKIKAAIKFPKPTNKQMGKEASFVHEFKVLQRINSPYIPKVLDSGIIDVRVNKKDEELPWFAIEVIKADTLEEEIEKHGILHKQEWLELAHDLLCAVAATHEAGIIHLDIKPDQVLRHSRRSILVDYGNASIAHVLDDGDTGISHFLYCSPEQINPAKDPEDLGYESDIFNVGATLVYAGTGVPPWDPANKRANARNGRGDLFTRMTTTPPRTSGLDEDQKRIIDLMLQTNPQHRTSAADAIELIRELLPSGSSRKTGDYTFVNMRSVAQRLTVNQKLDKTLAKQRAALAVQEAKKELLKDSSYRKVDATPKQKKEVAKDILLNRGENWWTGLRATIWLTLFTGPIGSGIRFYYLQKKRYDSKYANLDRKLVATLYGIFTFGLALPFICFEWFRQTKAKSYLVWSGVSLLLWAALFSTAAFTPSSAEGSETPTAVGLVAFYSFLAIIVLIPVLGFKSPDYSKLVPKEKKAKQNTE